MRPQFQQEIHAERSFHRAQIEVHIGAKFPDGAFRVARPLEFVERAPGAVTDPALSMNVDEAQLLMDELWRVGLRPTEGTGSAGSLAATERHLEDMRALVFKTQPKARK